jgi:NHL repeat
MAERRKRRLQARVVSVAAATVGIVALTATPACANVSHTFSATFGGAASTTSNPYPLAEPHDVAVDQASHDVYVTDGPHHRVEKFDSSGSFLLMFGKDVNKTKNEEAGSTIAQRNVCTGASGDICQSGASSSSSGAFQTPAYLAVDNYPGGEGDVYVGDTGDNIVQKFNSSGHLISTWGASGQKDGADATDLPGFGPIFGLAVGGPYGDLYVGGLHYSVDVWRYTQDGTYIQWYAAFGVPWLKVDNTGDFYYSSNTLFEAIPIGGISFGKPNQDVNTYQVTSDSPTSGFALDPSSKEIYQNNGSVIDHYNSGCTPPPENPCDPADTFGASHLSNPAGTDVDGVSHAVYVANSSSGDVAVFTDARPIVTTGPQSDTTESSVTLTGTIDPAGRGDITECHFEFGFDTTYGTELPCVPDPAANPPGSNFTGPTEVKATITGLSAGTKDHYRLVATNAAGATKSGADATFSTTAPPGIGGLVAEHLTATTADLEGLINPNGLETNYRFEFGATTDYGQNAPVPDGTLSASFADQKVSVHLSDLTAHVVYHYRLVAENEDGSTTVEDHTFNFYPPECPNSNVRQQTRANFLPDCRA